MSHVKRMEKEDKFAKLLRQFPEGKRIDDLARKLGIDRSTAYDYANSLELRGLVRFERGTGIVYPKDSTEKAKPFSKIDEKKIDVRKLVENIVSMAILIFWAYCFIPTVFNEVGSLNMTAWNFTSVESARTIMTFTPYLIALIFAVFILYYGIDIFKMLRRFYHCFW